MNETLKLVFTSELLQEYPSRLPLTFEDIQMLLQMTLFLKKSEMNLSPVFETHPC